MAERVICRLVDPAGVTLGDPIHVPLQTGPLQLTHLTNRFLNNEENLPYAFYVSDEELVLPLGTYLEREQVSVENILTIVYRPGTGPVNHVSATMDGHEGSVLCVSFSPDGKQLASGSVDRSVRLWDLNTQTPMFRCIGHSKCVVAVAWSPDCKHLVSGGMDGQVCCWIPETGQLNGSPLICNRDPITSISWEPVHLNYPCRRFVTCCRDGDARIWDITLKKALTCLSGVTCAIWGGEGIIYTGCQDCTVKMFHVTPDGTLCLAAKLEGHGYSVTSLALSTDYVLRTGAFDHTGRQYSSPEEVRQAALKRYDQAKGKSGERLVSVSDDRRMFLWEQSFRTQLLRGDHDVVRHVCFSPNGQWIASAYFDTSVKIWDGVTGKYCATFIGHFDRVYQISWSPDSRMLLSCSGDSSLKVWDVGERKLKKDLHGHSDEVYAVDWSPDGERVVSVGRDKCLKLWVG